MRTYNFHPSMPQWLRKQIITVDDRMHAEWPWLESEEWKKWVAAREADPLAPNAATLDPALSCTMTRLGVTDLERSINRWLLRRRTIPKAIRLFVWQRDQGRCVDCGSRENLEYDHIIPLARGGSSTERNIELRCMPCNRHKHANI